VSLSCSGRPGFTGRSASGVNIAADRFVGCNDENVDDVSGSPLSGLTRVDGDAKRRRVLGAWYTPPVLVDHVLDHVLAPLLTTAAAGSTIIVLDPACGDGRFLLAADERIRTAGCRPEIHGVDLDRHAAAVARQQLSGDAAITVGNGLERDWGTQRFDLVIGNPPFLNQLATATTRGRKSAHGGGPYANAAAEFLALAVRLARPNGGRVGMVLPLSLLSTRDAGPIRARIDEVAEMTWCWWAPHNVFDAEVRTCALGFIRRPPVDSIGDAQGGERPIKRSWGERFESRSATHPPAQPGSLGGRQPSPPGQAGSQVSSWSWLITDDLGIPSIPRLATSGVLGDRAVATADFRDEYYGLVGMVHDGASGPKLITCGLIEPGRSVWGQRTTRFAKQVFAAPRVELSLATPAIVEWSALRLVPKVLVANQTRIVEAVADPDGEFLPSVPVLTVLPHPSTDLWQIAALLTSAVASVWVAHRGAGAGLSATAIRLSPPALASIPWPVGSLDEAVAALRAGEYQRCSRAVGIAFGLDEATNEPLNQWWSALLRDETPPEPRRRPVPPTSSTDR
jgi:hypothetical protein